MINVLIIENLEPLKGSLVVLLGEPFKVFCKAPNQTFPWRMEFKSKGSSVLQGELWKNISSLGKVLFVALGEP